MLSKVAHTVFGHITGGILLCKVANFVFCAIICYSVTVSCLEQELQSVKERCPAVSCHCLDVAGPELPGLISQHQLVIK